MLGGGDRTGWCGVGRKPYLISVRKLNRREPQASDEISCRWVRTLPCKEGERKAVPKSARALDRSPGGSVSCRSRTLFSRQLRRGEGKRNVAVHCEKAQHVISSSSIFGWIGSFFLRGRNLSDHGLITSKIADPGSLPSLPGSKGIKDKIAYV